MAVFQDLPAEILDIIFIKTDVTTVVRNNRPWCLRYMPGQEKQLSWSHAAMKGNIPILIYLLRTRVSTVSTPNLIDIALQNHHIRAAQFIRFHEGQIRNIIFQKPSQRWKIPFTEGKAIIALAVSRRVRELRWLLLEARVNLASEILGALLTMRSEGKLDDLLIELLAQLTACPKRIKTQHQFQRWIRHPNEQVNSGLARLLDAKPYLHNFFRLHRGPKQ